MELIPIERREFKYLATSAQLARIRRQLSGICRADPHAAPDGTYPVRSLYFDTPDLRLFAANGRDQYRRYKVRVRTYPARTEPVVLLEVKHRAGDAIRKTRRMLPGTRWPGILEEDPTEPDGLVDLVRRYDLQPVLMVDYQREAWMSDLDDYGRVTFDHHIRVQPARGLSVELPDQGCVYLDQPGITGRPDPVSVVELKFAGPPPRWMMSMVERCELVRQGYSKYGSGVISLAERVGPGLRRAWV